MSTHYTTKKAMISQPMNGLSEEEILTVREKITKKLESMGYEVVNNYFEDFLNSTVKNPPVYFLGKSLQKMSECDAVYFGGDFNKARGCRIEHAVAMEYGLEIIYEEENKNE